MLKAVPKQIPSGNTSNTRLIIILNFPTSDTLEIVATAVKVVVEGEIARVCLKLMNDLPSFPSPIIELLRAWCVTPQSLQNRTKQDGVEFLLGLLCKWTQFKFVTFRAAIQVRKWPRWNGLRWDRAEWQHGWMMMMMRSTDYEHKGIYQITW